MKKIIHSLILTIGVLITSGCMDKVAEDVVDNKTAPMKTEINKTKEDVNQIQEELATTTKRLEIVNEKMALQEQERLALQEKERLALQEKEQQTIQDAEEEKNTYINYGIGLLGIILFFKLLPFIWKIIKRLLNGKN